MYGRGAPRWVQVVTKLLNYVKGDPQRYVDQIPWLQDRFGDIFVPRHKVAKLRNLPDAKIMARGSHVHVELIDLDRFISLWQEFHPKLTDEDKSKLPLIPIYFYAPSV